MHLLRHAPLRAIGTRVWITLALTLVLGASLLVGTPQVADANLDMGGGGAYCAAEFHSCPGGDSWCTWYGTCAGDGGFEGGFGGGGGGGGSPTPVAPHCGRVGNAQYVDAWIVIDLGTCRTKAICRAKRNALNAGGPNTGARAYCWANWNIPNSNGRHLVFARPANGVASDLDTGGEPLD